MFFKKKNDTCSFCNYSLKGNFNYCPHCGNSLNNETNNAKEFGMLGKTDNLNNEFNNFTKMGITDKLISNLMNSLVKNLDKQFKDIDKTEVDTLPNGIRIRISPAEQQKRPVKKQVTEQQLTKMAGMPRATAKTQVKRLSDRVIYEINAPGVKSPEDIFVSKLESGYEVKAIGEKKIYVNSLPINLPIKGFAINKNKIFVEFKV